MSVRHGWHPKKTPFVWKEFWRDMLQGIPALLMPVAIVLSIALGVCTASESAGIAVLYALVIGFLVYRELTWKQVWQSLQKTLLASSAVMLIIGFTYIFTLILTMQRVPQTIQAFFFDLNMPKWAIMLVFDVFILFIGTFIDVSPGDFAADAHSSAGHAELRGVGAPVRRDDDRRHGNRPGHPAGRHVPERVQQDQPNARDGYLPRGAAVHRVQRVGAGAHQPVGAVHALASRPAWVLEITGA